MAIKPQTAKGYSLEFTTHVRKSVLYLASRLVDFKDDMVLVGGLTPSLIIDQKNIEEEHIGTLDMDLGLSLEIITNKSYDALTDRLKNAGLTPDQSGASNNTRQRWTFEKENDGDSTVTVDFLIPPISTDKEGGKLQDLNSDLAAFITPGLHLAFKDKISVTLDEMNSQDEKDSQEIWVCGAGAFVVLKALAFGVRSEPKDAYDLYYVLKHYKRGVVSVMEKLKPLIDDQDTKNSLEILREKFLDPNNIGPQRAAKFLSRESDDDFLADMTGHFYQLLKMLEWS